MPKDIIRRRFGEKNDRRERLSYKADEAWDSKSLRSSTALALTLGSRMTEQDVELGFGCTSLRAELMG